ncbi:MAG: hypothetical protein AAGJ29_08990, partial [Pseudomonadota bacterium]
AGRILTVAALLAALCSFIISGELVGEEGRSVLFSSLQWLVTTIPFLSAVYGVRMFLRYQNKAQDHPPSAVKVFALFSLVTVVISQIIVVIVGLRLVALLWSTEVPI